MSLAEFIDLERYPIDDLDSARADAMLDEARQMMARDTLVTFPGFLRPEAVARLAAELSDLDDAAHRVDYNCTPYGWTYNGDYDASHARGMMPRRNCGVITTDQIHTNSATNTLFMFDELTEFIRRMLGYDTLYRSACEILSIQVNTMREGDRFGWHFDTNDGVVSFTIQNADNGGAFEYAPLIRDEDDENYAGVAEVIRGDVKAREHPMSPGTLSLFLGRRSLHRVAPVGPTRAPRISLLYSYDRRPGMEFPKATRERIMSSDPEPYPGLPVQPTL